MYHLKSVVIKLLASIVLMLFFIIPTFASSSTYKLEEVGLEVSIPSTYNVITRDTPVSSPIFKELGVSGKELIEQFKTTFIYLNAIPKGVTSEEIVVTMAPNDINNFSVLSATSLKLFASSWISSWEELGINISKYDVYEHSQAKFVRLYFEDTVNSVNGLQYYTIYNGKAINFTMRSYSGRITSTQEQAIKNIVDTIKFDTPPVETPSGVETEAFIYTDTKTNTKFTVPANWYEKELSKEREFIDVKFVSSKEDGMNILYGSTDLWGMLTPEEQKGNVRSDIDNSAFEISDIATLYGIDETLIIKRTYNGKEYFQATVEQTTELYGMTYTVEMTYVIRIENGWGYWFQFSGTTENKYFEDFQKLLNTIEYPYYEKELSTTRLKIALIFVVIVAIVVFLVSRLIDRKIRKSEQRAKKATSFEKSCPCCNVSLPNDSDFCHNCGKKITTMIDSKNNL